MKKILIFMCSVWLFAACYEDEHIQGEYIDYGRAYDTTSTDPVWKFVSQYYYQYGKHIILDPKPEDYIFNFQHKYDVKLNTLRDDKAYIAKAVETFKELFFNCYNDDARRMMFPYALILADSLKSFGNGEYILQKMITTNRYIAFAVTEELVNATEEDKVAMSMQWNSTFLQYCINKIGWTAPEEFYPYTDDELDKQETRWFPVEGGTEQAPNPPLSDIYWSKGFPIARWTYNYANGNYDVKIWGYEASSSRSGYLEKFIEFLLTTPQETIDAAIAKHEMLRKAHDVLDNSLKESFGIDYRTMIYKPKK